MTGQNDLLAYNITIQCQNASSTDPTIAANFSRATYRFLAYLEQASRTNAGQDAPLVDLARSALQVTGFDELCTILRTRYDIPFTICGDGSRTVRTDVCPAFNSMILLVVQGDQTILNPFDPEPQVIVEAIATFQYNNRNRVDFGLPALDMMTIPCITMVGTRPMFYKVPSNSVTVLSPVSILCSPRLSVVALRLPYIRPLRVWRSPIIVALLFSTTTRSMGKREPAGCN